MTEPAGMPEPESKGDWLATLGKILLWLVALAIGAIVLVLGTCFLMINVR